MVDEDVDEADENDEDDEFGDVEVDEDVRAVDDDDDFGCKFRIRLLYWCRPSMAAAALVDWLVVA